MFTYFKNREANDSIYVCLLYTSFSNAKVNASKMTAVTGDGYLVTITLDHICPFVQSGRRVKQSINAINKPLGVMPLGAGIRVGKRKI